MWHPSGFMRQHHPPDLNKTQIASAVFWAAFIFLLFKTWSLFQFQQLVNSPKNPGKINLPFPSGWANPDSGVFFIRIFHSCQSQLNWISFIWTAASLTDKSTFLAKGFSVLLPACAWDLILWGWCFSWYKQYYHQTPVTNLCTQMPALKMTVWATVLAVGKFLWVFST